MAIIGICNIFAENFYTMKKIIGIGNALVDLLATVENDKVFDELQLAKGGMTLVDYDKRMQIAKLLEPLHPRIATGGSVGNAMLALAHLGAHPGFIGKIGSDETGMFYEQCITKNGVEAHLMKCDLPTGVASTFISPGGERTFATYLGAGALMDAPDLSADMLKGYDYFFVEGYLVQSHQMILRAVQLAKEAGMKVCLDMASYNIVETDRDFITYLVNDYVDVVFANEDEAKAFSQAEPLQALDDLARRCEVAVVKVGPKGAWIKKGEEKVLVPAMDVPRSKVIDTTAAGDFFAAGFMYGYLQNAALEACGQIGSLLSGHIIQVVGTVLSDETWNEIKLNVKAILSE